MNERFLVLTAAVSIVIIFVVSISLYKYGTPHNDPVKSGSPQWMTNTPQGNSPWNAPLSTQSSAFGGIDVVDIFLSSKLTNGSYNESAVSHPGSGNFSSNFLNYTYTFVSQENMRAFEAEPSHFLPQWGGFDACMIASSACQEISPADWPLLHNWQHWMIQSNRLFFFSTLECRSQFRIDVNQSILAGDRCWRERYPESDSIPVNSEGIGHSRSRGPIRLNNLKGSR